MTRLAILISGSGTTAQAILKSRETLPGIEPVVVISSRPDAAGIAKAMSFGVRSGVVDPRRFQTQEAFGEALLQIFSRERVELVSQNGWLPLTPANVLSRFGGRIINQHPGPLDPGRRDFGGKGMFGRRVTCARIAFSAMAKKQYWTESTIHHVTNEFDKGTVIRVERLDFGPSTRADLKDTTQTIANTLLPLEHENVLTVLRLFGLTGEFPTFQRQERLVDKRDVAFVMRAKKLARELFPQG